MTDPQTVLRQLKKNLNLLQERAAKYGRDVPLALVNQIEDHDKAITLTQQAKAGALTEAEWRAALKPLLLAVNEGQVVNLDQQNQTVAGSQYNAGHDVVIYNYHYHGQAKAEPPTVADDADEPIPANPYRGLFAFRPEHASLFFGRESFTEQLIAAVESRRLVMVLGASGSGKSSVVFAGLVPALVNRPGEPWRFTTFRPGDDPFQNLAAALVPLYETTASKTALLGATRDLAESLRQGRYPLSDVLGLIRDAQPDHRLLLIADQFEELYTLCRDADTRHAFLDLLLAVFQPAQSPIPNLQAKIVFTLRADFLGQASLYRPWADALQGTIELLGPMTEAELGEAIEKPAGVQGVSFEEGLVETLLADVGQQAGSLPLLEFALSELWQHQSQRSLTHRAYVEIGQIEGALSRHADRAYAELSPAEQEQARRVFVQLVNPGRGTEDTRRLATRRELDHNWGLVAKLADERLVVTAGAKDEAGTQQDTVEVVHEALIRNWPQLRAWLDADREFLTWRLRLREDLRRWEETKQDEGTLLRGAPLAVAQEQLLARPADLAEAERSYIEASSARQRKQERQRRLVLIGVGVAALVMTVLALFSFFQWQDASRQRAKAQAEVHFLQSADPVERLAVLKTLFGQDDDSRARARALFFGLPEVDRLSLLRVAGQPEVVATVGRAILPNLADVNRTGYTDQFLTALRETVPEADLQAELDLWLVARAEVRAEQYELALPRYDELLARQPQNPALWYERAGVKVKLGQGAEALADLIKVMELVEQPTYADSGVLPSGVEFANRSQMAQAVRRLILVHPALIGELEKLPDKTALPAVATPTVMTDDRGVPMVRVPAGAFKMGSNDGSSAEQPVHSVYLDEFYIDQYEVTNEQFVAFLNNQGNQDEGGATWYNSELGQIVEQEGRWQVGPDFEKHPVTGVSWYAAKSFCAWRDGRLPTEAQWEKAARGDDERTYPWGEQIGPHLARYYTGSDEGTAEVGHYAEGMSPYGAYDMAGNVWEWVADSYDSAYYRNSPGRNPLGPEDEANERSKVLRGGSFYFDSGDFTRASFRSYGFPTGTFTNYGFRCAR